jgi:5-methylcytosine-specific restriction endonuclease McrA
MAYDAFLFAPLHTPEPRPRRNKGDVHGQKKRARARKLGAPRVELTGPQWARIIKAFHYACAYCGESFALVSEQLTQDHIVPLSRGGSHDRTNVVPACLSCNSSKQDLTAGDFFEKRLREKLG